MNAKTNNEHLKPLFCGYNTSLPTLASRPFDGFETDFFTGQPNKAYSQAGLSLG